MRGGHPRDVLTGRIGDCDEGDLDRVHNAVSEATGRHARPEGDPRRAVLTRVAGLSDGQARWVLDEVWPADSTPRRASPPTPGVTDLATTDLVRALLDPEGTGRGWSEGALCRALAGREPPEEVHLLNAGAAALRRGGHLQAAVRWAATSVERLPGAERNGHGFTVLGAALRQASLLGEAEPFLERAVDAAPGDQHALAALAALRRDQGRHDDADDLFGRAEQAGWRGGPRRSDRQVVRLDQDLLGRIRSLGRADT